MTTALHTDGAGGPTGSSAARLAHNHVDLDGLVFVRGDGSTHMAPPFEGTYHVVSRHHLGRYVNEFEFRWNTRKLSDHLRIEAMVAGAAVGKRLTYRPAVDSGGL